MSQLVIAAENFGREKNLFPVLKLTMSEDMVERIKLTHKVVDVMDLLHRKLCVTAAVHVDKPESPYATVRVLAGKKGKKENEKFQQTVHKNYKLEEFIFLLDVLNFVYNKVNTHQPTCNIQYKPNATIDSLSFFSELYQYELEH